MERNDIFRAVQELMRNPPLFLVGTGASMHYDLPGMDMLAGHLKTELNSKYAHDPVWTTFLERLDNRIDLETALTGLFLSDEIRNDIVKETWSLVSDADLNLFEDLILKRKSIEDFSKLLSYFYNPAPQKINIITSNYDRVIEYACDFAGLPLDVRFAGTYYKQMSTSPIAQRKSVNLLKVHGSLDLFQDAYQQVISLPLRREVPCGFIPCIITPGSEKYRTILQDPMRQTLYNAITMMEQATGYLCIGYGFNDEQIQANIITGIQHGKPILVATKGISDHAANLLANNGKHFITLAEGRNPNTTEVVIDRDIYVIEGNYWSIPGLLSILEEK